MIGKEKITKITKMSFVGPFCLFCLTCRGTRIFCKIYYTTVLEGIKDPSISHNSYLNFF